MKVIFYSIQDFEIPFLEKANSQNHNLAFSKNRLSLETLKEAAGCDAVCMFTSDDASANVLEKLKETGIHFICIRAAGHDNVDLKKAAELGIKVANVPEYSPYAIAEHTVAIILALNRKIITADKQVHSQNYTTGNLMGFDLHGKAVGIIGVGRIGKIFAGIMDGFGCSLLGFDQHPDESNHHFRIDYVSLEELCRRSDIISIHTGLNAETKYMINKEMIGLMKRKAMLINTSRGACLNTADVVTALEEGRIKYFGADVYENEKGVFFYDHSGEQLHDDLLRRLMALPNVLITPHQAFATEDALNNIATTTFNNIESFAHNRKSENELH